MTAACLSRRDAQSRNDHADHLAFRTGSARAQQLAIPAALEPKDASGRPLPFSQNRHVHIEVTMPQVVVKLSFYTIVAREIAA